MPDPDHAPLADPDCEECEGTGVVVVNFADGAQDQDCACTAPTVLDDHAPLVELLDSALVAITLAATLDQAQGIAHAALHREEYLGPID